MPTRMLRNYVDSLKFEGITAEAERLFVRLLVVVDDYGRFHSDSRMVKSSCYPLEDRLRPTDVDRWLEELATRHLVSRYEANSRPYLSILNFRQRLKRNQAKFPSKPGEAAEWMPTDEDAHGCRVTPCNTAQYSPDSDTDSDVDLDSDGAGKQPELNPSQKVQQDANRLAVEHPKLFPSDMGPPRKKKLLELVRGLGFEKAWKYIDVAAASEKGKESPIEYALGRYRNEMAEGKHRPKPVEVPFREDGA